MNRTFTRGLMLALLIVAGVTSMRASQFWNFSDTTMYHDADTLWSTTTLHGITYVTDGTSKERTPIFQTCGDRVWTSEDGTETLTFTMRCKINGSSSANYRWLYFTIEPGDTVQVWANSTSSSSARTLTFKLGGYSGTTISMGSAATGSTPTLSEFVYTGTSETTLAMISSGSWYTYAIRLKSNPNFTDGQETVQRWFFKHGWGDGLDASWNWRELYPNEDKSLYMRDDVYGGTGCNYADNEYGTGSSWVPLSNITLVDSPVTGDSAQFIFDPATKAITIRKTKDAPTEDVTVVPDPSKNISLAGGRVYLDNSVAGWDDEAIYLVVGNETASQCVRFLPDTLDRLTCPMPYTKEDITYVAVIGHSKFTSGAWGPSNLSNANHYSATYTGALQSGINDGWTIKLEQEANGTPITITKMEGEYGELFTTQQKNNCYRLDDELGQITFIFSTSRTRFVISPLNVKKIYAYGSITKWDKVDEGYVLAGYSADDCFYITLPYSDIRCTGNGGQPEYLFNVYHVNGNSYVTQSWPTLQEGCEEHLVFNANGWKQIVAFNDDDVEDLLERKATAAYIRPLSDYDLTTRTDQEKISNFRQVPGTVNLFRSYHPYYPSRSAFDTEYERLNWINTLATEAGIKSDIALSGNLTSNEGMSYTVSGVQHYVTIPDYYKSIIENENVLYVGTANGHTPAYNYALFETGGERFSQWMQEVVRFIADDSHPAPFQIHCHLGADRTGVFSGILAAMCGADFDDIAVDYNRTSDLQINEYRHSNQLRHALAQVTGFDPVILPSGEDAQPSTYTSTTLAEAKANHSCYTGGCALFDYPEEGTALPTLAQAVAAKYVSEGWLTQEEIDKCVAKLRGEEYSTIIETVATSADNSTRKVIKDGQIVIIRNGVTYDTMGRRM